ncbi:pentatricopeptide repeat-containing protein At4g02750-like [Selaginella moellendorffii]|uniref:pentatricopeptide repeat-containing protein At4g02750-like n=1 Tax=Selaginella moellendorffii TaxID=88036 RepID=UPI000D1CD4EF|nr:pentatricopeptide repeat-containing protein At4g02750-like [Selaginella moellendorffii]|eukprot:XP_024543371.1 pentatricopeptide repeat-containing protein At4g02750-like [Selaginella moellendorffii]
MIQSHCENQRLDEAKDLFDRMPTRNVVTWTTMITAYAQAGHMEQAKILFEDAPDLNEVAFTAMMDGYASNGCVEEAKALFERLPNKDVVAWNSMLCAYAANGHLDEALDCFQKMAYCDEISWTTMIHMLASRNHLENAKFIFDQIPYNSKMASTALLSAYLWNGHLQEGISLFQAIEERDAIAWMAMVVGFARKGLLLEAQVWFERMPEQDLVSWTAVVAMYASTGHVTEALEAFHRIIQESMMPDHIVFTSVLAACCHSGVVKISQNYFQSMIWDYGVEPTREHYCELVDAFARAGELDKAEELIHSMPFEPESVAWVSLLAACQKIHKDPERGVRAAQRLSTLGLVLQSNFYVLLSQNYGSLLDLAFLKQYRVSVLLSLSGGPMPTTVPSSSAPLLEALKRTGGERAAAFHFPGHGRGSSTPSSISQLLGAQVFQFHLPELPGLDNLHCHKKP